MQIRYVMCSIIMVYAVLLLLHDVIMMMTIKVTFSWAWVKCYNNTANSAQIQPSKYYNMIF